VGTGALSPRVNRPGCEGDHSPPSSADVTNAWSYASLPPHIFMAWCLVQIQLYLFPVVFSWRGVEDRYSCDNSSAPVTELPPLPPLSFYTSFSP
jgi:hypothetical protein